MIIDGESENKMFRTQ